MQFPLTSTGTLNLEALFAKNRALYGNARMEGDGDGGDGGAGGNNDGGGSQSQYTPPASQADLDRIIQDRIRRATSKYGDYDDLKAKADKHDALELELGSAADKAAAQARAEERAKASQEWTPRVVKAEFRAAAKGVLNDEQVTALLEDLDLSKFVTDAGDVDEEKVAKKIAALAPSKNDSTTRHQSRDLGQGNRQGVQPKPGDAGRAMAEKRFGKRS